MTTLPRDLETPTTDAPAIEPPASRQGLFGWLVVAVALVASTVLVAVVLVGGDDPAEPQPWYSVERGSITAIDHAAEAAEMADQPSIAAADHAAGAAEVADQPTIAAADHAAEAEASQDQPTIAAADHAADAEATEDDMTGAG